MSALGRLRFMLVLIIAVIAVCGAKGYTQGKVQSPDDPTFPYQMVKNWGTMPAGRTWGQVSALELDPDGKSIWVSDRCGANSCAGSNLPVVLKFDSSGKLLKSFGAGMFLYPHGLHVDKEGNVWVADARGARPEELQKFPDTKGKGHIVVKFSPEGKVLMTLGKPGVAGNPPEALNEPCDVAIAPNGDIIVSEGHSGDYPDASFGRISKFSKDGKFIKSWGKLGSAPGEFRDPHAIGLDAHGRLFVADRGNLRIQIFDLEGKFLSEFKEFNRVSGFYIDKNDKLYALDTDSKMGVRIGSAKDGKVNFYISGASGDDVVADDAGNIYVTEQTLKGVTKYVKR